MGPGNLHPLKGWKIRSPEVEQKSPGNNAAANDIEDADKEFGINGD